MTIREKITGYWQRFKRWVLIVVLGGGIALAAPIIVQTDAEQFIALQDEQSTAYLETGDYEQVARTGNFRVDVYESPRGKGYIIYQWNTVFGDGEYVRAEEFGPEGRSHDWIKIDDFSTWKSATSS